jgi:hypothetical protein
MKVGGYIYTLEFVNQYDPLFQYLPYYYWQAHKIISITARYVYIDRHGKGRRIRVCRQDLEQQGWAGPPDGGPGYCYLLQPKVTENRPICPRLNAFLETYPEHHLPIVYRIRQVQRRKQSKPIEWHQEQHRERVRHLQVLRKYSWKQRKEVDAATDDTFLASLLGGLEQLEKPPDKELLDAINWRHEWRRERRYSSDPLEDMMETVTEVSYEPVEDDRKSLLARKSDGRG